MRFAGTNLANVDLSDATFTVDSGFGNALADFTGADFSNADLTNSPPPPPPPPPPPSAGVGGAGSYLHAEVKAPKKQGEYYTPAYNGSACSDIGAGVSTATFSCHMYGAGGKLLVTNTVGEATWNLCGGQGGIVQCSIFAAYAVLMAYLIGIIFGLKDALTQSPLQREENDRDENMHHKSVSECDESYGAESDGNDVPEHEATRCIVWFDHNSYMTLGDYVGAIELGWDGAPE